MARRLMPDVDIKTDEDLLHLLEGLRQLGIAGHDEIDELAGLIRMKIERYGRRNGLSRMRAKFWGRQVARPLVKAADEFLTIAAYARVCRNRFEAFLIALDDERPGVSDFTVTSRDNRNGQAA
ncbi:hypothetical protein [Couchioplanes caeruleus]|uniref:Uncharacterized protein n=2 Tax=Couchioplanes caeruleus TaxID=56438 RepID=A0A1K0FB35_9ACTN|nr:hypothetical protein [Couchioplanes caeruleus]OJF10057.1 hypothetical protein BG844_34290 [Couchioplanes caeruleus subsp. caeruleus]ROP27657.1 hypothetical protein EDD30_0345 [Couchioplanes caeruleus]